MIVMEAVTRLLRNFAPEERSIPSSFTYPGRCEECLDALNDAFWELVSVTPSFLRRDTRGRPIMDPVRVSLSLTSGSTVASLPASSWALWMSGCMVVVDVSEIDNYIVSASASGGVMSLKLRLPFDGATGTHEATVYCDAFELSEDESQLVDSVNVLGVGEMGQISGPSEISMSRDEDDYGRRRRRYRQTGDLRHSGVNGLPQVFWMDSHTAGPASEPVRWFRLFPLVRERGTLSYGVRVAPAVFLEPDDTKIPLSDRHASAILLPVAAYHLLGSPNLRDTGKGPAVAAAYQKALDLARDIDPGPRGGPVFTPPN